MIWSWWWQQEWSAGTSLPTEVVNDAGLLVINDAGLIVVLG
jgi:hypothetical protein